MNANEAVHVHHGDPANAPGYKFLVTGWSVQAAGGPECHPGMDMSQAHASLHIDEPQFDAVAMEISATLNFCGVPAAEHQEFMEIIESSRSMVVEHPVTVVT